MAKAGLTGDRLKEAALSLDYTQFKDPTLLDGIPLAGKAVAVADAVRASMSISFIFRPATLTHATTTVASTLIDGGLLSNFPIDSLDRTGGKQQRWPTFGVTLLPNLPAAATTGSAPARSRHCAFIRRLCRRCRGPACSRTRARRA